MFYLYNLFKRPQTPHNDILFDHRDLAFDGHWFFFSHGLPFDLWCLTLEVYNWTTGPANSGLLQTSNVNSNAKRLRHWTIAHQRQGFCTLQSVLVQHFRFSKSYGWNISQLMTLILLEGTVWGKSFAVNVKLKVPNY